MFKKPRVSILAARATIALIIAAWIFGGMWLNRKNSQESPSHDRESIDQGHQGERAANLKYTETKQTLPRHQPKAISHASEPGCRQINFRHQHPGKNSAECSHQNSITIPENLRLNPDSFSVQCLRVDEKAVDYKRDGLTLSFAALVNPDSVVSVLYCVGKTKCVKSNCQSAKDPFLAAIGADVPSRRKIQAHEAIEAKWDSADSEIDRDVSANLPQELLPGQAGVIKRSQIVFKNWNVSSVQEACQEIVASARSPRN